ncbi:19462_t:CDS:2 [Funneliformis geosporum]|uniref:19462_t:CDS:1 n=1 Tax=Funneliformis geosporum TaxID=1117311 RepID=A0A9W4T9G8_9GLOM|nr:19462_t:CDS:2 [Funneliformis geosporum]
MKPEYIPARNNLLTYLQQPYFQPIEIYPTNYDRYFRPELSPEILNQFFVSSFKASMRVWNEFINNIAYPPLIGTTEDSFHAFWDALIIKPIKIGCPKGVHNRNTSHHTSTNQFRPDLSYLVFGACLARGEEKGPENHDDPAVELTSKLTWTYGNCPYIFGYYTVATSVTYCYLYFEEENIKRKDLITCSLDEIEGRIQAFNIGRNIGRLLTLLRQTVPEYFQQEFIVLHRSSGKVIELMQKKIVKRYPSLDSVMNLKLLYDKLAEYHVPYIECLEKIHIKEGSTPFVIFTPKGVDCKPQSKEQLIKALCCVLTALEALHKMKFMHRDIRWENVLRYINRDKWFIIDFDEACQIPSAVQNTQLAKDNHAPEIFKPFHNESVDIWSVGYLILTTSIEIRESDELKVYARTNLMAKDEFNRPTAKDALRWLWSKYMDILREEFLEEEAIDES